jgi:chromosome segregation ATPase
MSDLSELAEEAAEADDSVWFKDNANRIVRGLAEADEEINRLKRGLMGAAVFARPPTEREKELQAELDTYIEHLRESGCKVGALLKQIEVLEKRPGVKECHDYVETVNTAFEAVLRDLTEKREKLDKLKQDHEDEVAKLQAELQSTLGRAKNAESIMVSASEERDRALAEVHRLREDLRRSHGKEVEG